MASSNRAGLTGNTGVRSGLTGGKSAGLTGGRPNVGAARSTGGLAGKRAAPVPDPLAAVKPTGNLEQDAAAELTALESAYRDRAKQEADRFKAATDSEYWFAVCFKTRAEKDRFLSEHGLAHLGDKYLAGADVARALK